MQKVYRFAYPPIEFFRKTQPLQHNFVCRTSALGTCRNWQMSMTQENRSSMTWFYSCSKAFLLNFLTILSELKCCLSILSTSCNPTHCYSHSRQVAMR